MAAIRILVAPADLYAARPVAILMHIRSQYPIVFAWKIAFSAIVLHCKYIELSRYGSIYTFKLWESISGVSVCAFRVAGLSQAGNFRIRVKRDVGALWAHRVCRLVN